MSPRGSSLAPDDERTLLARYESIGLTAASLSLEMPALADPDPSPFDPAAPDSAGTTGEEPTAVEADLSQLSVAMDIQAEIGRGGMAAIRSATQRTLRRDVALKTLRPEHQRPEHARQLLQEARVQGALEHPAIVPVYLLATDRGGHPVIVMRRLGGKLWQHYVDEDGRCSAPPGEPDALRWHIRVLMQICDAVHFAHERGVLHRDLKLRNVMIGAAGEAYLIDFGLAASLHPTSELDLPWVQTEEKLKGTPGYMAPEMAAVEPERMGPWTDVYLLGACLHTVLTGRQRHEGRTMIEQLAGAWSSRPVDYAPPVPSGLAAIANQATARDPSERYPSAAAMREALQGWLDERLVATERASWAAREAALGGSWQLERARLAAAHEEEVQGLVAEQDAQLAAVLTELQTAERRARRVPRVSAPGPHAWRRRAAYAGLGGLVALAVTTLAGAFGLLPGGRSGLAVLLAGQTFGAAAAIAAALMAERD